VLPTLPGNCWPSPASRTMVSLMWIVKRIEERPLKFICPYPYLKRLFMSGYAVDIIAHHGVLDEGAPFIQKPFSIKDLAAKVRKVLDSE
jgi:hypothetical protein